MYFQRHVHKIIIKAGRNLSAIRAMGAIDIPKCLLTKMYQEPVDANINYECALSSLFVTYKMRDLTGFKTRLCTKSGATKNMTCIGMRFLLDLATAMQKISL